MIRTVLIFVLLFTSSNWCVSANAVKPKSYDIIIVGGGIAGLTAAYYLDDFDVLLLEMQEHVGGRASSGQYKTISFARGAEYLGKPEEPLEEMIEELGLVLREIPAPADVTYHRGKFYFGELGKAELLIKNSSFNTLIRFSSRIASLYDAYDEIPELTLEGELARLDTISAKQWFVDNNFPPIFHDIFNVTARGLFGANLDEISALAVLPELAFDFEDFHEIQDSTEIAEELSGTRGSTQMYTFDDGIAAIPQALALDMADSIQTGSKVTSVTKRGEEFEITYIKDTQESHILYADAVIIATPAPVALTIAATALSKQQQQLLGSVQYAPYTTVALFSDSPIFSKGFDLAIEDEYIFTDIYDSTWITSHFTGKDTLQTHWATLVYAPPSSFQDKTVIDLDDQELLERIFMALDVVLPESSKKVTGHNITRHRYGLPVMTPGSYRRMLDLDEITSEGLFLAGDYLIYPTFEAAAASGQLAAEKVKEWLEE